MIIQVLRTAFFALCVGLIVELCSILLSCKYLPAFAGIQNIPLLLNSLITSVFFYSLFILYDTVKCVLIIIDFKC